jgi:acetylornithine deacetylase
MGDAGSPRTWRASILSGHTDVVAGRTTRSGRDSAVQVSLERDGKLYGRGLDRHEGLREGMLPCGGAEHMLKANLKKPLHLAFSYDEDGRLLGACGA